MECKEQPEPVIRGHALAESGMRTIPERYIKPKSPGPTTTTHVASQTDRHQNPKPSDDVNIPIIDLRQLSDENRSLREQTLPQVSKNMNSSFSSLCNNVVSSKEGLNLTAPLSSKDLKNHESFRHLSPFEMLLKVTEADSLKLEQEKARNAVLEISKEEGKAINSKCPKPPTNPTLKHEEELPEQGMKKRKFVKTGDDEEWVHGKEKPFKKQKKNNYSKASCRGSKITQIPEAAELPESFKNRISEIGGTDTTLLIQKSLFESDTSKGHSRLLMPLRGMKTPNFLLNTELQKLGNGGCITLPMIRPSLQMKNIILTKWNMRKPASGRVSSNFVLRTYWNEVVEFDELKVNDVVQVWSFRVQGQLNLALVKLSRLS